MSAAAALLALAMAAATPVAPDPPLDCAAGFEALVAAAKAQPGAEAVSPRAGVPLLAVSVKSPTSLTVFTYTAPEHPAHPLMARRRLVERAGRRAVEMSTCPYGDKAASDALIAQFERMNAGVADQPRPGAPTR